MSRYLPSVLLLASSLTAQSADVEFTELLLDPVGPNAGAQIVEFQNRGQLAADTTGWHLVTSTGTYAMPAVTLLPGVVGLIHLGQPGTSTPFDLYLPSVPALTGIGTLAMFRSALTGNPADVVDFVSWGGGQTAITTAVLGGQWTSPQQSAVPPTVEGHTLAHYDRMVYGPRGEADAWFKDGTPTIGGFNDGGGIFAGGYGCPQLTYPPQIGSGEENNRPWIGEPWLLDLGYLPPTPSFLFLAIGVRSTPTIFLDPYGITGCYFEVQPLAVGSWPLPPLTGQIALSLPNDPSVVGLELRLQGAVTYPGANAANMLVTRVVHGFLGSR